MGGNNLEKKSVEGKKRYWLRGGVVGGIIGILLGGILWLFLSLSIVSVIAGGLSGSMPDSPFIKIGFGFLKTCEAGGVSKDALLSCAYLFPVLIGIIVFIIRADIVIYLPFSSGKPCNI